MATMRDEDIEQEQIELSDDVTREDHHSKSSDVQRVDEPIEEFTLDDLAKSDMSKVPSTLQRQFNLPKIAELYRNADSVSILLTGKTGSGKSTLANGILGLKIDDKGAAEEGKRIKGACTTKINEYKTTKDKVKVVVWDTPGLQDGTKDQGGYVRKMKDECTPRDLTIYCIKIADTRFVRGKDNPDVIAMKKLTKRKYFKVDFWKNTIIVLTFANALECFHMEWQGLQPEKKAEAFQSVIEEWRDQIKEILMRDAKVPKKIVDAIPVVPAGHYQMRDLPDQEYWLSALWLKCIEIIPSPESRAALIKINQERFKKIEDVDETDFQKEAEDQPIVCIGSKKQIDDTKNSKRVVAGGIIGGAVGMVGILGGPLVLISVPVGILIGCKVAIHVSTAKRKYKYDDDDVDKTE